MLPTLQQKLHLPGNPLQVTSDKLSKGNSMQVGAVTLRTSQRHAEARPDRSAAPARTHMYVHTTSNELHARNASVGLAEHNELLHCVPCVMAVAAAKHETPDTENHTLLRNFVAAIQDADPLVKSGHHKKEGNLLPPWSEHDGLILFKNRIWIPRCRALTDEIISRNHNDPAGGHYGVTKTVEILRHKYHWEHMS